MADGIDTQTPRKLPVRMSRLVNILSIEEPIYSGRDRVMGNDPLTVKRNRGADRENLTWTRGRTILQHTDRRKNGQPGLLAGSSEYRAVFPCIAHVLGLGGSTIPQAPKERQLTELATH